MTAPTPTPDPLARFRELLDQLEFTAIAHGVAPDGLEGRSRAEMARVHAALLAEAERLVAEREKAVAEIAEAMGLPGVFWDAPSARLYAEERAHVAQAAADETSALLADALSSIETEGPGCDMEPNCYCVACRIRRALLAAPETAATPRATEEA